GHSINAMTNRDKSARFVSPLGRTHIHFHGSAEETFVRTDERLGFELAGGDILPAVHTQSNRRAPCNTRVPRWSKRRSPYDSALFPSSHIAVPAFGVHVHGSRAGRTRRAERHDRGSSQGGFAGRHDHRHPR